MSSSDNVSETLVRRAAAEAGCDPRTLRKHLLGCRIRGALARERVQRAAERFFVLAHSEDRRAP